MGKKLAIKGHPTRGKKVIELLEMLGGHNGSNLLGNKSDYVYFITDSGDIGCRDTNHILIDYFTLEKFLEKYPFKVGDKVFLYDNITEGCVTGMEWDEDKRTVKYCVYTSSECWCDVKELLKWNTVDSVEKYYKEQDNMETTVKSNKRDRDDVLFDSIIWHLRNSVNNGKQYLSGGECEDYFREVVKKNNENKMKNVLAELLDHIKTTPKEELEKEFNELEEWTNVGPTVEEFKAFCECVNRKPKYPKLTNLSECKEILGEKDMYQGVSGYKGELLTVFQRLLIFRDAYWKIAGEEMGLGKPWDSTYGCGEWGYWIGYSINENKIHLQDSRILVNHTLVFPTAEMRDAFYENFKDLIEQCKELL